MSSVVVWILSTEKDSATKKWLKTWEDTLPTGWTFHHGNSQPHLKEPATLICVQAHTLPERKGLDSMLAYLAKFPRVGVVLSAPSNSGTQWKEFIREQGIRFLSLRGFAATHGTIAIQAWAVKDILKRLPESQGSVSTDVLFIARYCGIPIQTYMLAHQTIELIPTSTTPGKIYGLLAQTLKQTFAALWSDTIRPYQIAARFKRMPFTESDLFRLQKEAGVSFANQDQGEHENHQRRKHKHVA